MVLSRKLKRETVFSATRDADLSGSSRKTQVCALNAQDQSNPCIPPGLICSGV